MSQSSFIFEHQAEALTISTRTIQCFNDYNFELLLLREAEYTANIFYLAEFVLGVL